MKNTARAILTDKDDRLFLVVHNYFNPIYKGKWSTVGGLVEPTDGSKEECLKREFLEEFGLETLESIVLKDHLFSLEWPDEYVDGGTVCHHFYHVQLLGEQLVPNKPDEILEGKFFNLKEVAQLKKNNLLFFGVELDLYQKVIDGMRTA